MQVLILLTVSMCHWDIASLSHTHIYTHMHIYTDYTIPTSEFTKTKTYRKNYEILLEFHAIKQKHSKDFSCSSMSSLKELLHYLESKDMMPYLPTSFWQEFFAQMVVGPTPPYEMDNSLMMPSPSPKKTLIPELTTASAFCCL